MCLQPAGEPGGAAAAGSREGMDTGALWSGAGLGCAAGETRFPHL